MPLASPRRRGYERSGKEPHADTSQSRLVRRVERLACHDSGNRKPRAHYPCRVRKPKHAIDLAIARALRMRREDIPHERRVEGEEEEECHSLMLRRAGCVVVHGRIALIAEAGGRAWPE